MNTDDTTPRTTVGKTKFYQGEGQTDPLFCIEPGIPCQHARDQGAHAVVDRCHRFGHGVQAGIGVAQDGKQFDGRHGEG